MDIEGKSKINTFIVKDFNTPLTSRARSSRQKINKEAAALNDTLDQMDLIDIFRAFHVTPKQQNIKLFKYIWKVFYDTVHLRTQNKTQ